MSGAPRLTVGAALVGGAGLLATAAGFALDPRRTLFSWLLAWSFWGGIAVGGLVLLCTFHVSRARWAVAIRRPLEVMAGTLPLQAVLFLPVLLGHGALYPWASPQGRDPDAAALFAHQHAYMNSPLFTARAVAYFAIWIAVAEGLLRWSRRQDREGGLDLTRRQRRLGTLGLPPVALALSFAALDWLMALDPRFRSGLFPLYWFVGSFLSAIALLALWVAVARSPGEAGAGANDSHRASLGKLLLGFTLFWVYVAFCDWLLVWIADLPGEIPWFATRTRGGWGGVAVAVVAAQFALPFLALLSRRLKERPGALAAVAAWIALAHALDLYWVVIPAASPAAPSLRWTDPAAFVAAGGLSIAFAFLRMRRGDAVPARDPYLPESLRYAGR